MHRTCTRLFIAIVTAGLLTAVAFGQTADELERAFERPPTSARPFTWWHWMNGAVAAKGVVRDIQEMKRVGLGGFHMFHVTDGMPHGPVGYMSPQWRRLVKLAVQEAARQGLEVTLHNCAGWSSSGGPWIKPEQSMKMVVWSQVQVRGPRHFDAALPKPPRRRDFSRDIAVLAFPCPAGPDASVLLEKVSCTDPKCAVAKLVDGDISTQAVVAPPTRDKPQVITLQLRGPFTARAITVWAGIGRGGALCRLEVSADGKQFRRVAEFRLRGSDITLSAKTVNFAPATGSVFRLVFPGGGRPYLISIGEVELHAAPRVDSWLAKAAFRRADGMMPQVAPQVPPELAVDGAKVVDLSGRLDRASGRLVWDVPAGWWTILRLGYTTTGKENHPAPDEGRGLECDKMSRAAAKAHWDGMMAKVISDAGDLAGRTLKGVLIDSYEVGCQNWTEDFREEFRRRRGYDMLRYMPAMTGWIVDSREVSERFLYDLRLTVAELFEENYYQYFAEMAHRHGMIFYTEPYGNGLFRNLEAGAAADVPMSEFWVGWGSDSLSKQIASIAHVWGKKYVGAESFTAGGSQGAWRNHPYKLKVLGDMMLCAGVNRFIFHRYCHQPWPDRNLLPGVTMGPHGFHFEWPITWWKQAPAWTDYLARCQYLLQQGLFVADALYYVGEAAPMGAPGRDGLRPPLPDGHDYDVCGPRALLERVAVRDGRIVLPDGMSYAVLVLPDTPWMTPQVARKVRELVRAGATVVGPPPQRSPSLSDQPAADREVQAIAREVWGDCDGKKVTEHRFGKGRVVWSKPLDELFAEMKLPPDFEVSGYSLPASLRYIHRRAGDVDIYFVANQLRRPAALECRFRVTGKRPELWHPDTGEIEPAPLWRVENGRTIVSLRLGPAGSVFVVFGPGRTARHFTDVRLNGRSVMQPDLSRMPRLEILRAVYGVFRSGLPGAVDVTAQLSAMIKNNRLAVRASNDIAGDPAYGVVKTLAVRYRVDGRLREARVREGEMLVLPRPGEKGRLVIERALYGDLPENPWVKAKPMTVDVTRQLRHMVRDNRLKVVASNAIAGDPAPNIVKELRVEYALDGHRYTKTVRENATLVLPDGSEKEFARAVEPKAELRVGRDGRATLLARKAGTYELKLADGKTVRIKAAQGERRVEVSGPWTVAFQPGRGAPAKVVFERLVSWPEHSDPGVKYFSGTATYTKTVRVPAEMLRGGRRLYLDLGDVQVIAEVAVNGRELGVLWKPPFVVDITDAARPGENTVEVRVTNLWPNRLIGDEHLPPDDRKWRGPALAEWPKWLIEGKPRPPTRRITWTTWRHYSAKSPLLPSGLLGPVVLRSVPALAVPSG